MARAAVVLIGLAASAVLASVFGVIHDLVTWQISPEYYTVLKFWQFQLQPPESAKAVDLWWRVCAVGIRATWWVGAWLGFGLAILALIHRDPKTMVRILFASALIVVATATLSAVTGGLLWPHLYRAGLRLPNPPGVTDHYAFARVAVIHSFSYLGGALGGVLAALYSVILWLRRK